MRSFGAEAIPEYFALSPTSRRGSGSYFSIIHETSRQRPGPYEKVSAVNRVPDVPDTFACRGLPKPNTISQRQADSFYAVRPGLSKLTRLVPVKAGNRTNLGMGASPNEARTPSKSEDSAQTNGLATVGDFTTDSLSRQFGASKPGAATLTFSRRLKLKGWQAGINLNIAHESYNQTS